MGGSVSSQVKCTLFRQQMHTFSRPVLACNGLVVSQTVTVSSHVNNLAVVDEAVENSRRNSGISEKIGPLVKAFVRSNNQRGFLGHCRDKAKEKIWYRSIMFNIVEYLLAVRRISSYCLSYCPISFISCCDRFATTHQIVLIENARYRNALNSQHN